MLCGVMFTELRCREGGSFKAELKFPEDFPSSPPEMRFITPMWHPNSMCARRCNFSQRCIAAASRRCSAACLHLCARACVCSLPGRQGVHLHPAPARR
ncbi:hypothetical protein EON66_11045 [archaeon]|nr:MAG: hypothetical protein EON66_11045 [archaeon]